MNTKESISPRKPDPIYLLYAVCACLSFATGGVLRIFQGENVIISTAMTSIAFLMTAIVYFSFKFSKNKDGFAFPWKFPIGDNGFG